MVDQPRQPAAEEASVERLLSAMEKRGVSDLFVCEGKVPAARRHGEVVPLDLPPTSAAALGRFLASTLPERRLERFHETGDLDFGFSLPDDRRFRINLARQQGRIALVARALPSGALTFEGLGLPAEPLVRLAELSRGLVLVTGATGSGKSTTLAAMIHHINTTRRVHVVTLEEPIEFVHVDRRSRITQREVGIDTESFASALRHVVRESPDVILIGEMRDLSTMAVALQAALTGHLVLASLHTIDATQTLQRIASYFPAHLRSQVALDLSMSLAGIVSQRLLPRPDGSGRVVAVELLTVSPAAARLIREQRLEDLQDLMKAQGDPGTVSCQGMETGVATFTHSAQGRGVGGLTLGLDMTALLHLMGAEEASDLHLSVGQPPILRVTGRLVPIEGLAPLSAADLRLLLYSILSVRQRGVYELEREVDFALAIAGGRRFRVNAYHEKGNMAAAFRAISAEVPAAEALGLPDQLLRFGEEAQGLLLVVGPTGSGKTTSLACLIDRINHSRGRHIITIEDPIEYQHESRRSTIHQREVGADTQSFGRALKYILRQDPDVILVGEIRDYETVAAALTAAETGHLVLATLHTNDAMQTVDRLVDVFPAHQQGQARTQLAACLLGVVSQRLVPRADGAGRVAAFEVMVATPAVRTLIRDNKMHQAKSALQAGRAHGMQTLDEDLVRLVKEGVVRAEDAARYLSNPAALG